MQVPIALQLDKNIVFVIQK